MVVAVNKIDNYIKEVENILEFYSLGFEDVVRISPNIK